MSAESSPMLGRSEPSSQEQVLADVSQWIFDCNLDQKLDISSAVILGDAAIEIPILEAYPALPDYNNTACRAPTETEKFMFHGEPVLTIPPILESGHLRRGPRPLGDQGGASLFGVFLASEEVANTYAPPSILFEHSVRKYGMVLKCRVEKLRSTRNKRYFLTRENNLQLHSLIVRFWGVALPDYNQYCSRPLATAPKPLYFTQDNVRRDWDGWAPQAEKQDDAAQGFSDALLNDAQLDARAGESSTLGPIVSACLGYLRSAQPGWHAYEGIRHA
jgi:hypothetical protein